VNFSVRDGIRAVGRLNSEEGFNNSGVSKPVWSESEALTGRGDCLVAPAAQYTNLGDSASGFVEPTARRAVTSPSQDTKLIMRALTLRGGLWLAADGSERIPRSEPDWRFRSG